MAKAGKDVLGGKAGSRREFLVEITGLAVGTAAMGGTLLAGQAGGIELVRDGRSRYSIVLSPKASLSEQRGAHEFQHFLQEMSGAELPITTSAASGSGNWIFMGQSEALDALNPGIPYAKLGPEGFALKTMGQNLVIAGGRERGTMYGVSTFLEKLGCRWFAENASRIPRRPTITVPALDETQRPAFEYREPYATEAFGKDWAARNKVNGGLATKLDASTGGSIQYYPFVHSFFHMIPPKKYFATHPEYFALIDGRRAHVKAQLCLTNAALLRVATETVLGWIKEHPDVEIFSVSQNDWNGWCECANCQKVVKEEGAVSGLLLSFVNSIAEQVAARYPGKLIDTLAYQMTEKPPLHARPAPNVRVRLCPIGNCEAHPIESCPHSLHFMENLRGWSAITRQLYVWHYTTDFSHYLLPYPDFDELAADAGMYRRHGVVGIFFEDDAEPGGGGQGSVLRSYVMARLLWNPATDVEQDVKEFHEAYYGQAARPMLDYYKFLEHLVRFSPRGEGQHVFIRRTPDFAPQDLQQARRLLRQAEGLAENDAVRRRVRKEQLSIDYVELLAARRFEARNGQYAPVNLAGLTERFHNFMAELERLGNYRLHALQTNQQDQEHFAAYMKPYALTQLENDSLRVNVVPELSGRIVGLTEKSSSRNVLRCLSPEEVWSEALAWNPNFAGLGLFAYGDFFDRKPMEVTWSVEPGSAQQRTCRLTGKAANGLQLERSLELDAAAATLRTHTRAVNNGAKPITVTLASTLDPNPVDRNAPMEFDFHFLAKSGQEVVRHFSSLTEEYLGEARYQGEELPAGEWLLKHSLLALDFTTRFDPQQVDRCTAKWRARGENWMTMGVWSKKRTLATGEQLELGVSYHIRAS
ncbi:MAG TPA: DUF4838 domain-containing protein [Terriglobia bacterium]|nr:DUF4838 domain-containing protein [Terriglobia bacterium]